MTYLQNPLCLCSCGQNRGKPPKYFKQVKLLNIVLCQRVVSIGREELGTVNNPTHLLLAITFARCLGNADDIVILDPRPIFVRFAKIDNLIIIPLFRYSKHMESYFPCAFFSVYKYVIHLKC